MIPFPRQTSSPPRVVSLTHWVRSCSSHSPSRLPKVSSLCVSLKFFRVNTIVCGSCRRIKNWMRIKDAPFVHVLLSFLIQLLTYFSYVVTVQVFFDSLVSSLVKALIDFSARSKVFLDSLVSSLVKALIDFSARSKSDIFIGYEPSFPLSNISIWTNPTLNPPFSKLKH